MCFFTKLLTSFIITFYFSTRIFFINWWGELSLKRYFKILSARWEFDLVIMSMCSGHNFDIVHILDRIPTLVNTTFKLNGDLYVRVFNSNV